MCNAPVHSSCFSLPHAGRMGCMKSTLSEGLSGVVEGKISQQTVRTEQTHYVRDPTSNTKNHIVSSQTVCRLVLNNETLISSLWDNWQARSCDMRSFLYTIRQSGAKWAVMAEHSHWPTVSKTQTRTARVSYVTYLWNKSWQLVGLLYGLKCSLES